MPPEDGPPPPPEEKPAEKAEEKAEERPEERPEERKGVLDGLFLEHYNAIVVKLMAKFPQLGRDAAHAAYVKLQNTSIRWEAIRSPKAYLFKIALREAKNMAYGSAWARRIRADSELAAKRVNEAGPAARADSAVDAGSDAEAAFNQLTDLQKQVYVLNTEDGLPARAIAAVLSISQDRAERALTHARRKMKEVLSNTSQGRMPK